MLADIFLCSQLDAWWWRYTLKVVLQYFRGFDFPCPRKKIAKAGKMSEEWPRNFLTNKLHTSKEDERGAMVEKNHETERGAMLQYVHVQISQRYSYGLPSNDMLSIPCGKYHAAPCFWAMLFPHTGTGDSTAGRWFTNCLGLMLRNNCFNTWRHLGRRQGLCSARWAVTILSPHLRVDPQRVGFVAGSDWRWKQLSRPSKVPRI